MRTTCSHRGFYKTDKYEDQTQSSRASRSYNNLTKQGCCKRFFHPPYKKQKKIFIPACCFIFSFHASGIPSSPKRKLSCFQSDLNTNRQPRESEIPPMRIKKQGIATIIFRVFPIALSVLLRLTNVQAICHVARMKDRGPEVMSQRLK